MTVRPTKVRNAALSVVAAFLLVFAFVTIRQQNNNGNHFADYDLREPSWKYPQPRAAGPPPNGGVVPGAPRAAEADAGQAGQAMPRRLGSGALAGQRINNNNNKVDQIPLGKDVSGGVTLPAKCGDYTKYANKPHTPVSDGPLKLPFQRPDPECRTFVSQTVEKVIDEYSRAIVDPDLRMLFTNCFPNTLDTTIRWHQNSTSDPQTFLVTGDIDAEWLRDSHRQLSPYIRFATQDPAIKLLVRGAIATQADMVRQFPYCNAFHPPAKSGMKPKELSNTGDMVYPPINKRVVFECKYELDSLASFLGLSNEYFGATTDATIVTDEWLSALRSLLKVVDDQSQPTFANDGQGSLAPVRYRFQRQTTIGTETLNLAGMGNPVNANTSLVRSAFRPSDDATIFQFFIPANAMMSVELKRAAKLLRAASQTNLADQVEATGTRIEKGIWEHGTKEHPVFGKVFAYEVDGFGGTVSMDDANIPSLLDLPDMGFVDAADPTYVNTRNMILCKTGNPYYLVGPVFEGIGGPHIGVRNAWPMSHLVAMRTSNDEKEIAELLELIKDSTSGLGLMHESLSVDVPYSFTRPWFSWANSEFAKTIFDLADRFPELLFGPHTPPTIQRDRADLV